jgi:hypothetical protein
VTRIRRNPAPTVLLAISMIAATGMALPPNTAKGQATQPFLPDITISSTIPKNGDLNPYGVAIVPQGFPSDGEIAAGDILVSNFNNSNNLQGTGTTIIKFTPNDVVAPAVPAGQAGNATTFFQGSPFPGLPGLGLTLGLGVLQRGFVLVGAVPTTDGTHVQPPGALFFIDRKGRQISPSPYTNQLDGPWGLTVDDQIDQAKVFVSNVLNGTVTRLDLAITSAKVTVNSATVIASGYAFRTDPAAVVLGPTGLVFDRTTDTLYVASTADNAIFAVPNAGSRTGSSGTGAAIFQDDHLRGPLALVFAPDGNLITSNGDAVNPDPTQPSEIVEFTKTGKFIAQFNVDAAPDGAFGVGTAPAGLQTFRLVVVDDNANDLTLINKNVVTGD